MPVKIEQVPTMVKSIKVQIGDEWSAWTFAKPLPLSDAVARAQQILDTFKDKDDG